MRLFLFTVVLCLFAGSVQAKNLCRKGEDVYFSCKIDQSEKFVSVCGVTTDGTVSAIQYRFGTLRRLELSYPPSGEDSARRFQMEHVNSNYGDGGGQFYNALFFRSGAFYYSVMSGRHSNEDGKYEVDREISVYASDPWNSSAVRTLKCSESSVVDNLIRLYNLIGEGTQVLPKH